MGNYYEEYDEVLEKEDVKISLDEYYETKETIDKFKNLLDDIEEVICDKEKYPTRNALQGHIAELIEDIREEL